ncbi:outer membrane protein assembly factor BamD [Roseobacter sp. N2S]|nr:MULTISPECIES: outer membrane protein assembly factor BamD [Rhodobacterales]MDR6264755.1 outer membrane protein assembly factor BamD [Roseobacter sp. N2S]
MMQFGKKAVLGALTASVVLTAGCARREQEVSLENQPPEMIYQQAEAKLAERRGAEDAAQLFTEVERLYPYSEWAKRSIIMSAYSYHQAKLYEESRGAAQRYLDFYPTDEDAAYAQYLIALSFYDQIDNVSRDQGITFQALQALRTTVERYPDSEYASSALLKFDLALDHLAGKEMDIGRFYMKKGHFGAAINRFRVVVEDFQTTTHTPEALHRLVEAYLSLGLDADAQTAGAILGHNFQGTNWYKDSHVLLTGRGISTDAASEDSQGWLKKIWRQVARGEWL